MHFFASIGIITVYFCFIFRLNLTDDLRSPNHYFQKSLCWLLPVSKALIFKLGHYRNRAMLRSLGEGFHTLNLSHWSTPWQIVWFPLPPSRQTIQPSPVCALAPWPCTSWKSSQLCGCTAGLKGQLNSPGFSCDWDPVDALSPAAHLLQPLSVVGEGCRPLHCTSWLC